MKAYYKNEIPESSNPFKDTVILELTPEEALKLTWLIGKLSSVAQLSEVFYSLKKLGRYNLNDYPSAYMNTTLYELGAKLACIK